MTNEFPAELVERCREAVVEASLDRFRPYDWVIHAVLRTSGHAELVAGLKEAAPVIALLNPDAPVLARIDAALAAAGHKP